MRINSTCYVCEYLHQLHSHDRQTVYLGSKTRISPASVPSTRQLLLGSFHESLRITAIAVNALGLTSGTLLYCSAKLTRKLLSIDRNFNVRGERNAAPSSFSNSCKSSASVSAFNSSSSPHLCQIYVKLSRYSLQNRKLIQPRWLCTVEENFYRKFDKIYVLHVLSGAHRCAADNT